MWATISVIVLVFPAGIYSMVSWGMSLVKQRRSSLLKSMREKKSIIFCSSSGCLSNLNRATAPPDSPSSGTFLTSSLTVILQDFTLTCLPCFSSHLRWYSNSLCNSSSNVYLDSARAWVPGKCMNLPYQIVLFPSSIATGSITYMCTPPEKKGFCR